MRVIGAKECKARLSAQPTGAYLFFGEEEHLKSVYLSRFRALVTENPDFNVTKLELRDGADPIAQLAYEMDRLPFLSDLRFLDVRGLDLAALSDSAVLRFHELLERCPSDLILIFYFFECDVPFKGTIGSTRKALKDLPVYQNLPENVTVVNFTHPTVSELVQYYEAKFKSRGVLASRAVVQLFCARVRGNMTLSESESEKLIALASAEGGTLTQEMVDESLPGLAETQTYKLTDAIEKADAARAISEYEILRGMKFEPIRLLPAVTHAVAHLFIGKGALTEAEAEEVFGIKKFKVRPLRALAAKISVEQLKECQLLCSQADRKLKNEGIDADVLVQTLILRICHVLRGKA